MSSILFDETAFVIKLCGRDDVTPLVVELKPMEKLLLDFLSELSKEISDNSSQPTIEIEKFPSDEYYKKRLNDEDYRYYDELVKKHCEAYEAIAKRLHAKKQKKTPKGNNK